MNNVNITLDNKVTIPTNQLPLEVLKILKSKFRHSNPKFFKNKALGYSTWNVPPNIETFEFQNNGTEITFFKGGLPFILNTLKENNLNPQIQDNRYTGPKVNYSFDPTFEFRDYQKVAIQNAIEAESGMVNGAPASGKSEISLGIIAELGYKAIVLVHDTNLLQQWIERISLRLGIPKKDIGQFGGGKKKIGKQITVGMYQTVKNHLPKLANRFGIVIADEVHHSPAKTFLEVNKAFTSKYMFGFSATIKRQDERQFLSYDLYGDIVYKITRQDLVELGFTTDVELHIVYTDYYYDYCNVDYFTQLDEEGLIDYGEMNVKAQRKFLEQHDLKYKDYGSYLEGITLSAKRNSRILYDVKNELDNGAVGIIFTKRREFCRLWKRNLDSIGYPCVILWGGNQTKKDKKETKESLAKLKSGEVKIAVGTVLDEAIDLPRVDVGFITYRNSTHAGQQEQQAGRLARLFKGKDTGKLYYYYDYKITKFKDDIKELKKRFERHVIHGTKQKSEK